MTDRPKVLLPLYLPVESHVRELDAKILLAAAAASRGRQVLLGEQNALRSTLYANPPGIFISKSFSPRHRMMQADHFAIMRQMGFVVTGWDEEGLVHLPPDVYAVRRLGPEPLRNLQAIFSWGPDYTALVKSLGYYDGTSLLETGNPRIDLYRRELRAYHEPEVQRLRAAHGNFILINSNFGRVNPAVRRNRDGSASGKSSGAPEDARWHAIMSYRKALYEAFQSMLVHLAKAFPDRRIVVRPHPAERAESWAELASGFANVTVLHEGAVAAWILTADMLIHNGCTTAVEAALLDRPAIAYAPLQSDELDWKLPNAVSHHATTPASLEAMLKAHLDGSAPLSVTAPHQEVLAAHVTRHDSQLAVDLIAGELDRHEAAWRKEASVSAFSASLGRARSRFRNLERGLRQSLADDGSQLSAAFMERQFPAFPLAEIEGRLRRFQAATGRFHGVSVRGEGPRLYRFHPSA